MTRRLSPRSVAAGAAALALAFSLAACTATTDDTAEPTGTTTTSSSTSDASATPTSSASAASFHADGDAEDNLAIFTEVVNSVWSSDQREQGRAYIDALVEAGFTDKATMQLTPDQTTIGQTAESIQFAVRWSGQCLVGQVGSATGDPVTAVQPVLSGDVCLIGSTRAIDW